jgi:subtilase family serine protease
VLPPAMQSLLSGHRGMPDVSFNGDPITGVILVESFMTGLDRFLIGVGGTSASTPQWAGLVAIANQRAGRPLGFLNANIYRLAARGRLTRGLHDVTVGNNTFAGVVGFDAARGWDAATGWGSPSATELVLALIDERDDDDRDPL